MAHQRKDHRFVPGASVCRDACCYTDCLAFDWKAGLCSCSTFHGVRHSTHKKEKSLQGAESEEKNDNIDTPGLKDCEALKPLQEF